MKKALLLLLVTILMCTGTAALPYTIEKVVVGGVEVDGDKAHIELGQTIDVEVFIRGNSSDPKDVNVKTWIGGYEHGDVESVSDLFDIEQGVTYKKVLTLNIPSDMETDSHDYTLHIEVYDSDEHVEKTFTLYVEETRHLLNIIDIKLEPAISIDAGKKITAAIRVKNLGAKKEEDIKVVTKMPELGITDHTFIEELVADEEGNDDEEDSASAENLYLEIPEDTPTGDYKLIVEVYYNSGHDITKETKTIYVRGKSEEEKELREETKISVEKSLKKIVQGGEDVYKISLANYGEEAQLYELRVVGAKLWAEETRVETAFAKLEPKESQTIYVYAKAKQDAKIGMHSFMVKVLADKTLIEEIPLAVEIEEKKEEASAENTPAETEEEDEEDGDEITGNVVGAKDSGFSWFKTVFLTMVILLVVGGGIIAVRRLREQDEHPLEPREGKTYY